MKKKKKKLKIISFLLLLLTFLSLAFYSYNKVNTKLEIKSANNIQLYDYKNELFFQGNGSTSWTNLNNISQHLINATISTEDKNFYKHFGFDIPRIFKSLWINILSKKTKQGASTITQQYTKNLFLDFDKTWERKYKEMWLTINMELHYSKEEILEGYLNTINYGHGMYGIENAANFYFNKKAKDLTLAESAMLAGIPKSPANYSPLINLEIAKNRQRNILNGMLKNKFITKEELNNALNEKINLIGKKKENSVTTAMYYQNAVLNELENINSIPKSFLDTGGLKIYTNYNYDAQKKLEESIKNNLKNNESIQTAGIMMDPNNGNILALIGGRDYQKSEYNRAIFSKRQVGSTMKPLLYYSALENGFTASTAFTSEETTFTFSNNKTYSPKNANDIYGHIPISLAAAISYSDNIYAVKTHMFLGEENLVNFSKRLGIKSKLDIVPSLPLGTNELTMLELIRAYATFANQGYKVKPHFINKITDMEDNTLYTYKEEKELILNPSLTYILSELLTTTYDKAFINYNYPTILNIAPKLSRKYSIKSGTTATDSWTIGYTPNLVTSIWCGYDDNKDIKINEYNYTKNIWADTMESFLKNTDDKWYKIPSNVVGAIVDPISGAPATKNTKNKKILYYLKGTEPTGNEMAFDEIDNNN